MRVVEVDRMGPVFFVVFHSLLIISVAVLYFITLFVLWRGASLLGRVCLLVMLLAGAGIVSRSGIELAAAVDELSEGEG